MGFKRPNIFNSSFPIITYLQFTLTEDKFKCIENSILILILPLRLIIIPSNGKSFLDAEAPSDNYDSSKRCIEHKVAENGSRTKGREIKGYKFALADERKFLFDQRLLSEHIKDKIIVATINGC